MRAVNPRGWRLTSRFALTYDAATEPQMLKRSFAEALVSAAGTARAGRLTTNGRRQRRQNVPDTRRCPTACGNRPCRGTASPATHCPNCVVFRPET